MRLKSLVRLPVKSLVRLPVKSLVRLPVTPLYVSFLTTNKIVGSSNITPNYFVDPIYLNASIIIPLIGEPVFCS